ncbi:hypothetical protein TKK_0015235 [Trichogramma kaykai]|uniref:Odorant receptor n=1 Tax=Trichogramma kaykai TaxID=54128 RepID=A0ABD2WC20_9HYME
MDAVFDNPNYMISKLLLKFLGLWPTQSRLRKNLSFLTFTFIIFSLVIPIFRGMLNNKTDLVIIIEDITGILYLLSIYTKYLSFYVFEERMIRVYNQLVKDLEDITIKEEKAILRKHARQGRFLSIIYVSYGAMATVVFNSTPYIPLILDKVFPLNETRDLLFPYYADYYFIDAVEYHYTLFTFHGAMVICAATLGATAVDSMFVVNVKHNCGLFNIVCYRLENIGKSTLSKDHALPSTQASDEVVYREMKSVFISHRNSIESSQIIQETLSGSFLFIFAAAMAAIAMLVFDIMLNLQKPIQIIRIGVLLVGVYLSIFYMNYIAQQIMNDSEKVNEAACNSYWYHCSPSAQKLVQLALLRSQAPIILSAGGVFDMNLATFASMIKSSASYATVLLQMQQK